MEIPVYTFLPTNTSDNFTCWASIAVMVISGVALFFLLRKKSSGDAYRRQMLLAMLVFFALIIAATTAFFSFWSIQKTGPVQVYQTQMETPYGMVAFEDISRAYIELNGKQSLVNPGANISSVRMLFIEEIDGKMHVMSEKNYDIDEILNKMKSLINPKDEKE